MQSDLLLPLPLARILSDVIRAFEAGLYYPALVVALTLPEICASMTLEKSEFVRQSHYVAFVDKYTTPASLGLDGLECYRLRGGVIHRGNAAGHPLSNSTHVIFTVPESGSGMHAFSIEAGDRRSAMFDLKTFCAAMDRAVRLWYADHRTEPQVQSNIASLLSWRPDGIRPFLIGAPVVGSGPD